MQENTVIKIKLFGLITLEYQGNKYNLEDYLTKQLLDILKMLILNYKKPSSNEWIIQTFWKDSENPMNSLKFSIFRLRKSLKMIPGLENIELVKTANKGYELDSSIQCEMDTYEFEQMFLKISFDSPLTDEQLAYAEKMERLYVGSIKVDTDHVWFILMEEHYREMYLKTVKKLCDYFISNGNNEKLKTVAMKAATLEPMVEENHFYYIQSLINTREGSKAFEYYQKSTKMLIDEYAMNLSDKMKDLYNYLIDGLEDRQNSNIITDYFKKKEHEVGALYCNNSIFDYVYDMHLRNADRSDQKYYLFVFEIKAEIPIEKLLPKIKSIFQNSLRSGDVFTRINKYQFLVLLPCQEIEMAHMIARRITRNFRKKILKEKATLYYNVENVIN